MATNSANSGKPEDWEMSWQEGDLRPIQRARANDLDRIVVSRPVRRARANAMDGRSAISGPANKSTGEASLSKDEDETASARSDLPSLMPSVRTDGEGWSSGGKPRLKRTMAIYRPAGEEPRPLRQQSEKADMDQRASACGASPAETEASIPSESLVSSPAIEDDEATGETVATQPKKGLRKRIGKAIQRKKEPEVPEDLKWYDPMFQWLPPDPNRVEKYRQSLREKDWKPTLHPGWDEPFFDKLAEKVRSASSRGSSSDKAGPPSQ